MEQKWLINLHCRSVEVTSGSLAPKGGTQYGRWMKWALYTNEGGLKRGCIERKCGWERGYLQQNVKGKVVVYKGRWITEGMCTEEGRWERCMQRNMDKRGDIWNPRSKVLISLWNICIWSGITRMDIPIKTCHYFSSSSFLKISRNLNFFW